MRRQKRIISRCMCMTAGVSAFLAFLRTLVLLTEVILVLPYFCGITGLWLAVSAAELLAWRVSMVFYRRKMQEIRQKSMEQ